MVILGIGPVGLIGVQGCAMKGAARIICVDHRPKTEAIAKDYGATHIVDYKKGNVYEQVMEITGGEPVDSVLVACSGGDVTATDAWDLALRLVKWGGAVSNLSFWTDDSAITIDNSLLFFGGRDKIIHTTMVEDGRYIYERYLRMIEYGKLDTSKLVSHEFHGWGQLEEAIELMKSQDPEVIKPVIWVHPFDEEE